MVQVLANKCKRISQIPLLTYKSGFINFQSQTIANFQIQRQHFQQNNWNQTQKQLSNISISAQTQCEMSKLNKSEENIVWLVANSPYIVLIEISLKIKISTHAITMHTLTLTSKSRKGTKRNNIVMIEKECRWNSMYFFECPPTLRPNRMYIWSNGSSTRRQHCAILHCLIR